MKKKIIFDTMISGHHLEYLHHIYEGIAYEDEYIFIVPEEFELVKNKFEWSSKDNVSFEYIPHSLTSEINNSSRFKKGLKLSCLLKRYYKEFYPNEILLISIIDFFPFLILFFNDKKVKISGIIYKIYLYEWREYSITQKIYEAIRQMCMVICRSINKIYILNDTSATCYLNKYWHTNKFKFLPDPYVPFSAQKLEDIRYKYNIPLDRKIFLHMGSMDERKGTLEILDAINKLNNNKNHFVFAGKISKNISDSFYYRLKKLLPEHNITVIDDFCSYELLASLSSDCDCILLPYKRTSLSSGIIYYAAQFNKSVIATSSGLLGKIVKRNKLGYTLKEANSEYIANAIESFEPIKYDSTKFLENKTIVDFSNTIMQEYNN